MLSEAHKKIFDINIDSRIVNAVVNWQLAKRRSGNHAVKNMSTVHGTNKKPHKQKGGGRARQGSKKAPHMRGGAVSMGPVTRSHAYKINKKVRKLALKMIIADKINNNAFVLLKNLDNHKKTKDSVKFMEDMKIKNALIVSNNESFNRNARNIKNISILHSNGLNVYSIIKHNTLMIEENSWKEIIEKRFMGEKNDS